jgi:hypothetical protein
MSEDWILTLEFFRCSTSLNHKHKIWLKMVASDKHSSLFCYIHISQSNLMVLSEDWILTLVFQVLHIFQPQTKDLAENNLAYSAKGSIKRRYSICPSLQQFRQIVARKRFLAGDQIFKFSQKKRKRQKIFFSFFFNFQQRSSFHSSPNSFQHAF